MRWRNRLWLRLAQRALKNRDRERALAYMDKGKDSISTLQDQIAYVNLLHGAGRSQEGLTLLGQIIDQKGASAAYERRAHLLRELGRGEEAITDLDEAIMLNKDNYLNWYTRGVLNRDLGKYEEAIRDLKQSISREGPESIISTYYELGMTYVESGDPAAATRWFQQSIQRPERSIPMYYFMLARCLCHEGKPEEAKQVLLQGVELADRYEAQADEGYALFDEATNYSRGAFLTFQRQMKESFSFRLLLADTNLQLGDIDGGLQAIAEGLARYPGEVELYLKRAMLLSAAGRADEAKENLRLAVHQEPDDLRAYAELLRLLREEEGEAGEEAALELLTVLMKRQPRTPIVCYWAADSLYRLGRYEHALDMNSRLLEVEPDDPANYIQRADIYIEMGSLPSAEEAMQQAVKLENSPEIHNKLSYIQYLQGHNEDALLSLQQTAELDPEYEQHPAYQSASGHIYKEMGMWDLAVQAYSRAIRAEPRQVKLYEFRAGCFLETGQLEQAAADCTRGLELDGDAAELYSLRSSVYYAMKDYPAAAQDMQQYLHFYPEHPGAYYRLGQMLYKNREEEAALAAFDRVLSLIPEHADCYLYKAHIYFGQLEPEAALQHIVSWGLFYDKGAPVGERVNAIRSLEGFTEEILEEAAERLRGMYGQSQYLS
ncbi:tetratricopeptide repeat protein [Paenibacillus sp. JSM ZJ436]|uniref:tetratricopeptide repeat protein n=1 Tax=Paenibacillus sp. JSM ZJ436 TaxID=3376190 RepID=UPI00379FE311